MDMLAITPNGRDAADGEIRDQLSFLHPSTGNLQQLDVDYILDNFYPFDLVLGSGPPRLSLGPSSTPENQHGALMPTSQQNLDQEMIPFNQARAASLDHSIPPIPLALFGPAEYLRPPRRHNRLEIEPTDDHSDSFRTPGTWVIFSRVWALGGFNDPSNVPDERNQGVQDEQNQAKIPDRQLFTWDHTRVLRAFGPAERVNAEYLKWFLAQKFEFKLMLHQIVNRSFDQYTGDLEIRFDLLEQADKANQYLNDPELSEDLEIPVTVEFLPEA